MMGQNLADKPQPPGHPHAPIHPSSRPLYRKYRLTAWFYDLLDYPWERQYSRWRPRLLEEVTGRACWKRGWVPEGT
ncbi:MAG TPA: hypothetical protein EYH34_17680 [Planctomycetes bacterium]|nr:hypothetical protein [Planctomycetota bacterium]